MITIPEYVYEDDAIQFVCPALELAREDAARMHAVLTDPSWPDVLDEMKYICYAFRALGVKSAVVSEALIKQYNRIWLEGCVYVTLAHNVSEMKMKYIAKRIRIAWCRHMRDCLEKTIKQG